MKQTKTQNYYATLKTEQYRIDKTEALEKGITAFPSVFVEGATTLGKTTAVRMLLEKHTEVTPVVFLINKEDPSNFMEKLEDLRARMTMGETIWVVFEQITCESSSQIVEALVEFIETLPEAGRAILVSSDRPAPALLELLWKGELLLLPQETLLFTREDIQELISRMQSPLDATEIYEQTDGWPGFVYLLVRLSVSGYQTDTKAAVSVEELCKRFCYEINTYIHKNILGSLNAKEQRLIYWAKVCPWLNNSLCQEILQIEDVNDTIQDLWRKGMLLRIGHSNGYRISAPLRGRIQVHDPALRVDVYLWQEIAFWYESHGHLKDALYCLEQSGKEEAKHQFLIRNYDKIPFLNLDFDDVITWKEDLPEICYLRGMYDYLHRDQEGINREITHLRTGDISKGTAREVWLNLNYVKTDLSLDNWLTCLESGDSKEKVHLYEIMGGSFTPLCGLRDLSGMFSGTRKDQNRRQRIWREYLGAEEQTYLALAKIHYDLETSQMDAITEEELGKLLDDIPGESWKLRLARLYVLNVYGMLTRKDMKWSKRAQMLEESLKKEGEDCIRSTEAVLALKASWMKDNRSVGQYLQNLDLDTGGEITEFNYITYYSVMHCWLLMNRTEKTELLQRLIPFMQHYGRSWYLTGLLYAQAVIQWMDDSHGVALKSTIESFVVNGEYRYVMAYCGFGQVGLEVLEAYVDWVYRNMPESWHRKKKYNYGNIHRMPLEDYLELVLRTAKRVAKHAPMTGEEMTERLTMMEMIILQNVSDGLSNAEICEELNLKLSTVKGHIYSVYKKLGVKSRMQAVLRSKEMGLLR